MASRQKVMNQGQHAFLSFALLPLLNLFSSSSLCGDHSIYQFFSELQTEDREHSTYCCCCLRWTFKKIKRLNNLSAI